MNRLEVSLKPRGDKARIALLSCVHIGSRQHDEKHFQRWLREEILRPDTWAIMLGDTIDNGTKQSPGAAIYEQTKNPKDQVREAFQVFRPLAERKKLLFWHESNHSYRTFKESGFLTAEEWLSDELGIPWAGFQCLSRVTVGRIPYVIHSMHGEGSGTAMTSPIMAVTKQAMIAEADCYVRGHHHRPCATRQIRYVDLGNRLDRREVVYGATGCFLSYDASYGESKGYIPNAFGCAVLELGARRKEMRVII